MEYEENHIQSQQHKIFISCFVSWLLLQNLMHIILPIQLIEHIF